MIVITEVEDKENEATNNPLLSIIIVNYNVKEYILNCIQSIQDKIDAKRCPYEVIVSDNGSTDGSIEAIRERFTWVKVIENKANLGFGKANNIGAKQAQGEVLFFLNPDTLIIKGIEEMVEYLFNHAKVALIGPLNFDEKGNELIFHFAPIHVNLFLQLLDIVFLPLTLCYISYRKFTIKRGKKTKRPIKTGFISGCAMTFNRYVFNLIGGFDNSIFMYGEETDIGLMIKKVKYNILIYPNAEIIHYGEKSTTGFVKSNKLAVGVISFKKILQKHFPITWFIRYRIEMLNQLKWALWSYMRMLIYYAIRKNYSMHCTNAQNHIIQFKQLKMALRVRY